MLIYPLPPQPYWNIKYKNTQQPARREDEHTHTKQNETKRTEKERKNIVKFDTITFPWHGFCVRNDQCSVTFLHKMTTTPTMMNVVCVWNYARQKCTGIMKNKKIFFFFKRNGIGNSSSRGKQNSNETCHRMTCRVTCNGNVVFVRRIAAALFIVYTHVRSTTKLRKFTAKRIGRLDWEKLNSVPNKCHLTAYFSRQFTHLLSTSVFILKELRHSLCSLLRRFYPQ